MEVTRKIECICTVHARLSEDGEFVLSMRGQAPYSKDGMATAEVEVNDKLAEAVREALLAVLEKHHQEVALKADHAAMIERGRAIERREINAEGLLIAREMSTEGSRIRSTK